MRLDIIAGLTLWVLIVQEGMAYAGIAGLLPQTGLLLSKSSPFVVKIMIENARRGIYYYDKPKKSGGT